MASVQKVWPLQGNTLIDLVGLVLDRPTSLVSAFFQSSILALVVDSARVIYHIMIELIVPSDA